MRWDSLIRSNTFPTNASHLVPKSMECMRRLRRSIITSSNPNYYNHHDQRKLELNHINRRELKVKSLLNDTGNNIVHILHLPDTNMESLKYSFANYGTIEEMVVGSVIYLENICNYAVIKFQSKYAAAMAVNDNLKTESMKVRGAATEQTLRTEYRKLMITNLDPSLTPNQVYDELKQFGMIRSYQILSNKKSSTVNFGSVTFHYHQDAKECLGAKLNLGKYPWLIYRPRTWLEIAKSNQNYSIDSDDSSYPQNTVKVYNIPKQISEEQVFEKFQIFGPINNISKYDDYYSIRFSNDEAAKRSLSSTGDIIAGSEISVQLKISKLEKEENERLNYTSIQVRNINNVVSESDLHQLFSQFGKVKECKLYTQKNNLSQFGYVLFYHHSSAKDAVDRMDGKLFKNRHLYIDPTWYGKPIRK
ncbi:hypothetical protein BC833DRAFT_608204 [Globomyces pollinis-pini]|nr:hypothetical protein BC833DRAFT_608204 [Globomyces pollinis-pini]